MRTPRTMTTAHCTLIDRIIARGGPVPPDYAALDAWAASVDCVLLAICVDVFGVGGRVGHSPKRADKVFAVGENLKSGCAVAFHGEPLVDVAFACDAAALAFFARLPPATHRVHDVGPTTAHADVGK